MSELSIPSLQLDVLMSSIELRCTSGVKEIICGAKISVLRGWY